METHLKPFAEVVRRQDAPREHRAAVLCGGKVVFWSEFASQCDDVVNALNAAHEAAVERREARLRGALMQVGRAISSTIPSPDLAPSWERLLRLIDDTLLGNAPDYVPGDVACGLAFDIGAMQWTQHVLMRAIDVLDAGGQVAAWLEANGLRRPKPEDWSKEELLRRQMEAGREWAHRCRESGGNNVGLPLAVDECPSCGETR